MDIVKIVPTAINHNRGIAFRHSGCVQQAVKTTNQSQVLDRRIANRLMFSFIKSLRRKSKKAVSEVEDDRPSVTAQQLVQTFHSESALCDPAQRDLLIEAAACTQQQIDMRRGMHEVQHAAIERCRALGDLQKSVASLRKCHSEVSSAAVRASTHLDVARHGPIQMLEDTASSVEERMDSLRSMAGFVEEASACLSEELNAYTARSRRASLQRSSRSFESSRRGSFDSTARDSMDYSSRGSMDYSMYEQSREFAPVRRSMDESALRSAIAEAETYIDQVTQGWAGINVVAFQREVASVHRLVSQYEQSTTRRAEMLERMVSTK